MVNRYFQPPSEGELFAGLARQKAAFAEAGKPAFFHKHMYLFRFCRWHGGCNG
jgi:hypothetical protein